MLCQSARVGLELEAPLDQRHGSRALRLLVCEHPREVQRVGVVRSDLEDAAVQVGGGRPLLVLLQGDGDRDRLADAERAILGGRLVHPARLSGLVRLEVVLEVDAGVERAIGLLRPVLEVDLRKDQAHDLGAPVRRRPPVSRS